MSKVAARLRNVAIEKRTGKLILTQIAKTFTDQRFARSGQDETELKVLKSLEGNEMKFFKMKKFAADESGAVTVDWVVLTAAMVAIGGALISVVSGGITTAGNNIVTSLGEETGGTGGDGGDGGDTPPAE